jgi:hypothetical protein
MNTELSSPRLSPKIGEGINATTTPSRLRRATPPWKGGEKIHCNLRNGRDFVKETVLKGNKN